MIHRRSVVTGYCSIKSGESDVIVAGGQEVMSRAPHAAYLRAGVKFGNYNLTDTLIEDGLTDAFHNIHMAITGETVRQDFSIKRNLADLILVAVYLLIARLVPRQPRTSLRNTR